ncbi:MAG TPA: LPS assembly protein LptD [Tepidisphaeraceae bacterium]|nr:LPS assembly protein LptD [Tepidisphaeraceae bacterium]
MAALVLPAPGIAQQLSDPISERLTVNARRASTWSADGSNIVLLDGPVTIELDQRVLSAKGAVIWLTPVKGMGGAPVERAEIALIGDAQLKQLELTRKGEQLMVMALVGGNVRIAAAQRVARDESDTELFQTASQLRLAALPSDPADPSQLPRPIPLPTTRENALGPPPGAAPATRPAGTTPPISFRASLETIQTPDGKLAAVLSPFREGEGILLYQQRPNGDFLELQAERGVIFTQVDKIKDAADDLKEIARAQDAVSAVYLEGDVRVTFTPADSATKGEQTLEANRVFYDFTTDRAVLTDAVMHSVDPTLQIPMIVRADTLRQLSRNNDVTEFNAKNVRLSTSGFAVPSYSIAADKAYVRQVDTNDPRYGTRTSFIARDATLRMFDVPIFWLPALGGTMTERGTALRGFNISNSRGFGTGLQTEWGLFETLGRLPPEELDVTYRLDYFSDRGPAGGIDGEYGGGFITDTTKQPWNFEGEFTSYLVYDSGTDNLGRYRRRVTHDDEWRGRASWEHQHFFPDNWHVQFRASHVSDPTFMEEWYERDFETGLPLETSAYFKHQQDSEVFSLLFSVQPNDFVTTSDLQQEQFEIERMPEINYRRIGDSLFRDRATFFSNNTLSRLQFSPSEASLLEQGFGFNPPTGPNRRAVFPGRPSLGRVGVPGAPFAPGDPTLVNESLAPAVTDDTNYRTDWRQELDFPMQAGQFKVVPYLLGRLTTYTETPNLGAEERWYSAAGVRMNTAFWKVDDSAYSRLFDINRVRHIVEPEVHLFAAAQTLDRDELFIYDEQIDAIHDFRAAQVALRQRWQTKRGSPRRRRSVDFLTLNVEGNFFGNQPPQFEREPVGFRGAFFPSLPEASIPRNSVNVESAWRVSDTFVVLADVQQNLDRGQLATGSLGLAVSRDPRVSYFIGTRYIAELDSVIASLVADYVLTTKYSVSLSQSYDFGDQEGSIYTSASLRRRFDRFHALFTLYYDAHEDESGFRFSVYPEGLIGIGGDSSTGFLAR